MAFFFDSLDIAEKILPLLPPSDIANLRLVSHHLNLFATPYLYQHVELYLSPSELPQTLKFIDFLYARPQFKVRSVTTISGTCARPSTYWEGDIPKDAFIMYTCSILKEFIQRNPLLHAFSWNMKDAIPLDLVRELQSHGRIRHITVQHVFTRNPLPFQYLISVPTLTSLSLLILNRGHRFETRDLQRSFTSFLSSNIRHHLKGLSVKLHLGGGIGEFVGERDFDPGDFVPDLPVLEELELYEFGKREWHRMPKVFRPCDPWNFHAGKYPALRRLKLHKYAYSYELMRADFPGDVESLRNFLEEIEHLEELGLDRMTVKKWATVYPEDSKTGERFPFTPLFERHGRSLKSLRWPGLFAWISGYGRTPEVAAKYWAVIRICSPFLRDFWVEHCPDEVATKIQWTNLVEQRMWNLTYVYPCLRSTSWRDKTHGTQDFIHQLMQKRSAVSVTVVYPEQYNLYDDDLAKYGPAPRFEPKFIGFWPPQNPQICVIYEETAIKLVRKHKRWLQEADLYHGQELSDWKHMLQRMETLWDLEAERQKKYCLYVENFFTETMQRE